MATAKEITIEALKKTLQTKAPIETTEDGIRILKPNLEPDVYYFKLEVVDDADNHSTNTALVAVTVRDTVKPTAKVRSVKDSYAFGEAIELSGAASEDTAGGSVKQYLWRMVTEIEFKELETQRNKKVIRNIGDVVRNKGTAKVAKPTASKLRTTAFRRATPTRVK